MGKLAHFIRKNFRKIGVGLFVFVMALSMLPAKSQAFSLFNGDGNDGYYLSITNDPDNIRVVPVVVYDSHPKKQMMQAFLEYSHTNTPYAKFHTNKWKLPTVQSGQTGKENWLKSSVWSIYKKHGITPNHVSQDTMLAWTFPGFAGQDVAEKYQASEKDMNQAMWVSDTLVQEFNNAISFVHSSVQKYGDKDLKVMSENQFANMLVLLANAGREANMNGKASFKYHGVTFNLTNAATEEKAIKKQPGVPAGAYVKITVKGHKKDKDATGLFIEYVEKGYRKGQKLYNSLNDTFQNIVEKKGNSDPTYLNWKHIVLQSNSLWSSDSITFTNIGKLDKPGKFEQYITDMFSNVVTGLRQLLGLYSTTDLITNGGTRGTSDYYNGIMPRIWMDAASVLHWISFALAWMLIIGAIVKLLVQRNVAAINPSERVDMINGIKNLMIVGFALSVYDLIFAGLTEFNFLLVKTLSNASQDLSFFGNAPIGMGMLAGVIVTIVFFCFDVYFNFFYISRALTVAILYAVGPLYVASIAFGEKYRQIFGNYCRELIGNIFVQSFHAVILVFFTSISLHGNLRTFELMVLLFCFIPLTRFFKESIGASTSTVDTLSGIATAATTGFLMNSIGFRRGKGKADDVKGGGTSGSAEGNDIRMKSSRDFDTKFGQLKRAGGSLASAGVNVLKGGAQTLLGTGLAMGGSATGMKGVATAGGFLMGNGLSTLNNARHDLNADASLLKSMGQKAGQTLNSGLLSKARLKANQYHSLLGSDVMPKDVRRLADNSVLETYDKAQFSNATGITGFRDLDNVGDELEVSTGFVAGQGFSGGSFSHLRNTEYEARMNEMVQAFQNKDLEAMQRYQERGINGIKVDKDTNRVSLIMDKKRTGIGNVYHSGENLYIQRQNYNDMAGMRRVPSRHPDRKYVPQHTNPINVVLNPQENSKN